MSRVDDDRQAARYAEKMAAEKRAKEQLQKEKLQGESAFGKLMQQSQAQKSAAEKLRTNALPLGSEQAKEHKDDEATVQEHGHDDVSRAQDAQARLAQARAKAQQGAKSFGARLENAKQGEAERAKGNEREGLTTKGRAEDARSGETKAEGRKEGARTDRNALSEKRDEADAKGAQSSLGRASQRKGELKADDQGGGSGQGQGGGEKKGDGGGAGGAAGAAATMRFNPALMAPVPLAKPKDNAQSEKLRALANEIAQKIVKAVRVGKNAAGEAEFQIDLKSDVLKGLSVKISGQNGKIKATFSGQDRQVLKMLKEQSGGLRAALESRGLRLEDLKFEERA